MNLNDITRKLASLEDEVLNNTETEKIEQDTTVVSTAADDTAAQEVVREIESETSDGTAEDVSDNAEEVAADAETVSMMTKTLTEIYGYRDFVNKNGVDRTFLAIVNHDDELSKLIRVSLPACESFSAVGDARSRLSKDVVAGLENVIKNIWQWIKDLVTKVWHKIQDIILKVINHFRDIRKRVEVLKTALGRLPTYATPKPDIKMKYMDVEHFTNATIETIRFVENGFNLPVDVIQQRYTKLNFSAFLAEQPEKPLAAMSRHEVLDYIQSIEYLLSGTDSLRKEQERFKGLAQKSLNNANKNMNRTDIPEKERVDAKDAAEEFTVMSNLMADLAKHMLDLIRFVVPVPERWIREAARNLKKPTEQAKDEFTKTSDEDRRRTARDAKYTSADDSHRGGNYNHALPYRS